MNITEKNTIGEIVADNYRHASVFQEAGIDFCCNGNKTLQDACTEKNIDQEKLIVQLHKTTAANSGNSTDYRSWPLDLLADYIEKKHHRYVEAKIPEIKPYLEKICRVHGERHPELLKIKEHFAATAGELVMHMKKEELLLFPYIRKMEKAKQNNNKVDKPRFGSIENPILTMMHEHTTEGDRFKMINALSKNYTPPSDACNTYKITYSLLKEFEQDLFLHIHLENNILFPKSIELEKQVLQ